MHGLQLDVSTIRKILKVKGYRWLPRAQKPRLSPELMARRVAWAQAVLCLSDDALREKLSMSLDGVVLSTPPKEKADRENFCKHGDTHMYRRRSEAADPKLAGHDPYPDQVRPDRAVPLWGGISAGGAAIVTFHQKKKLATDEWVKVVRSGKLSRAIMRLDPVRRRGPWTLLCDNETFLKSPGSMAAYASKRIDLWHVPPKSPDLNPVEKFWGWLRRELRRLDLGDLREGRPPLTKALYRQRIRYLCETQRAQRAASAFARSLRSVCTEVVQKRGARARA